MTKRILFVESDTRLVNFLREFVPYGFELVTAANHTEAESKLQEMGNFYMAFVKYDWRNLALLAIICKQYKFIKSVLLVNSFQPDLYFPVNRFVKRYGLYEIMTYDDVERVTDKNKEDPFLRSVFVNLVNDVVSEELLNNHAAHNGNSSGLNHPNLKTKENSEHCELLEKKLRRLQKAFAIETDTSGKFKLGIQIDEVNQELEKFCPTKDRK